MVNLDNYEVYILDYLEGNLSGEISLEMASFLDAHPSIKEEVRDLLDYSLVEVEPIVFEDKKALKKKPKVYNRFFLWGLLGLFLVAYMMATKEKEVIEVPDNKIELNTPAHKGKIEENSLEEGKIKVSMPGQKEVENKDVQKAELRTKNSSKIPPVVKKQKEVLMAVENRIKKVLTRGTLPDLNVESIISKEEEWATVAQNKEDAPKSGKQLLRPLKIQTIEPSLLTTNTSKININTLAYASPHKAIKNTQPTVDISIHLGSLARAKEKLNAFWKKEKVRSVKEALTPEYFAKN